MQVARRGFRLALLWANVATLARLLRKQPSPPPTFLTENEARDLLSVLKKPGRTIVLTLLVTGCRIGEVLALRWKHVDFAHSVLHIREAVYLGHFGSPKTLSSIGDLPLGPNAIAALHRHRERAGTLATSEALVFPNEKGGPLDSHNLRWRVLYPACKAARVPRVTFHALRHTHASLLNTQGESIKTIQEQLRHSSARVSLEIYTHTVPQQRRDAVERLECSFGPKRTQVQDGERRDALLIN